MRKRHWVGIGTGAVLLAAGGVAFADPLRSDTSSDTTMPTSYAASTTGSLTLPTGDQVALADGGMVAIDPAEGRENTGYWRVSAADGSNDTIIVPVDVADDIASGKLDPRRFNVSALLKDGFTDAAEVPESALDDRPYDRYAPAAASVKASAAAQKLTVKVSDHSGNAPQVSDVNWQDLAEDGELGYVDIGADGTGTAELEPGSYDLTIRLANPAEDGIRGETISGIASVTISDEPVELTVDGTTAEPISVEVDAPDAQLDSQVVDLAAGEDGIGTWESVSGDFDTYVLPSTSSAGEVSFVYAPILRGGTDAAEPYVYNLNFGSADGIPQDLNFAVSDSELAAVDTRFESLGLDTAGVNCEASIRYAVASELGMCRVEQLTVPSTRTTYYTPGGELGYSGFSGVGETESDAITFAAVEGRSYQPGPSTQTFNGGAVTTGFGPSGVIRWDDGLATGISMVGSADPGIDAAATGYSGTVTLAEGDKELGRYEGAFNKFAGGFLLDSGAAGRYTLSVDGSRRPDITAIGTHSTVELEFDAPAAPGEDEGDILNVSMVTFSADGVVDGYADRDAEQTVALGYRPLSSSHGPKMKDLGFEVSYDDGKTWTKVDIDRDGNAAAATLKHPADAGFVSVRFHATDDAGNVLDQTTYRSYGLK